MGKKVLVLVFSLSLFSCALRRQPEARGPLVAGKDFNFYLNQGANFLRVADYDRAVESLTQAIALNPKSYRAYNLRGIAYFYQRNFQQSEDQFKQALSINPSYAEAYTNLGSLYFASRRIREARAMLEKAINLSPSSVAAHYTLRSLLLLTGDGETGAGYLRKAVELDPAYLDSHPPFEADIPETEKALGEMYFTFAKIYAEQGQEEKTLEYLEKARQAGFKDWERVKKEKEFEAVRQDPRVQAIIR